MWSSDFILQNICKFNQIRYPKKTPFSGKRSQKNDMIGYATLIAPEISSEIKPMMYIFLLYAHMGLYYMENLHYYTRECCYCSITGCPLVRPSCGYKRWVRGYCQKNQHSEAMACIWCSCSRPPEIYVVLSSKRCQKRACEWQIKSLLPNPATPILSSDPFWESFSCIFL